MKHKHNSLKDARAEVKKVMNSGEVPNDPLAIIKDCRDDTFYVEVDDGVLIRNFEEIVESW